MRGRIGEDLIFCHQGTRPYCPRELPWPRQGCSPWPFQLRKCKKISNLRALLARKECFDDSNVVMNPREPVCPESTAHLLFWQIFPIFESAVGHFQTQNDRFETNLAIWPVLAAILFFAALSSVIAGDSCKAHIIGCSGLPLLEFVLQHARSIEVGVRNIRVSRKRHVNR